ncbi:MAG: rod shape-determining protein MreC [Lachnospiraceae bacterium]|nr:rod shape-determining protein MreC [Lachnospiraceae bacterium]MDD7377820.1 rod shape-determining protein MreC [Lachnospiraceae bacterium]MDY4616119.1 rod shape-determining protein MreC [Lachnospiraceae bacterium]
MKRKKTKFSIPARYLLLGLCGIFIFVIFLSYSAGTSGGPLNSVASYIFVPMQKGINSVGTFFSNKSDRFQTLEEVMDENEKLQEQVEKLTTELNTTKLEQYELEDLRNLYQLDQQYSNYKKTGAHVIGKGGSNWFNIFLIDKGSKDGIEKDMNVIAGSGLVGIIIDVGPHYAKVRSIIDDSSKVSGMVLSTSDSCIVKGDLKSMNEDRVIQFSELKDTENQIKEGDQIVTSNVSDKYLPGISIGYISEAKMDSNNITKSGTITPSADFEHLREVLVILDKKTDAVADTE